MPKQAVVLWLAFCLCHAVVPNPGLTNPGLMAAGTLVVLIPTREGLVFAADSLSRVPGAGTCDKMFKIVELKNHKRTAISVTGNAQITARPSDGSTPPDLCAYFKTAQHYLDIPHVVQEELDADNEILDSPRIKKLGARCVQAVTEFSVNFNGAKLLDQLRGTDMFQVVIGTYKPKQKSSLMISFPVRIRAEDGKPEMGDEVRKEVTLDDPIDVHFYGVAPYVYQVVLGGIGQQYIGTFAQFESKERNIKDITASEAKAAAINVIEATEQTAKIVPPPDDVGGPVDVILIDSRRTPTHLAWKPE